MRYNENLINITDKLCDNNDMYSLILLDARSLNMTLSGYRCFLDGKYILCLNIEDKLAVHGGYYSALNLRFQPYFYNVNLNHNLIGMEFYNELRDRYGYPDFRFFRMRDDSFFGIIPVSESEYKTAELCLRRIKTDIASHATDDMWSCRSRSGIISVLHIVESAFLGKESGLENEILRYIHDNITTEITLDKLCAHFKTNRTTVSNLVKEKTGLPPMKYVLAARLTQSRPDLLFTLLTINEIAEKYGFSDVNYYIRAFKKHFGKSPLQFRKDGVAERMRDAEIYRRRTEKERIDMSVAEFSDYFKKGLGRAIIRLKTQKDKEPYKKVFKEILFSEEHKYVRRADVYEKELLDIFDDREFTKEIAEKYLKLIKEENEYYGSIPLLNLLGYRDTVAEILEEQYKDSYARLLEYTKKPWDGEKYPPFAGVYMRVSGALARYMKVGDQRIKQIFSDIADLYDYCDHPVVPTYQNPMWQIMDGVGKEHFQILLDEIIEEHKNGRKIDMRSQIVVSSDDERNKETVTPEYILSQSEWTKENWYLIEAFYNGGEELHKTVAKAALEETDIVKKLYLLNYFAMRAFSPDEPLVEFPLDVEPLIKLVEDENFALPKEPPFGLTMTILPILKNKKCKAVHDLAVRLYYDNSISDELRKWAIMLRFGKNYIPESDQSDFVALLLSNNKDEKKLAIDMFKEDVINGVEGLPLDLIPYIFVNITPPWARGKFCEMLAEKNLMPYELREECLYDYDKFTRELFLKTKKPNKTPCSMFLAPPNMPEE